MPSKTLKKDYRSLLQAHALKEPRLGRKVYLAAGAVVTGDVRLGDHVSILHHAVLRGDINKIVVGHHSNIQDNAVVHVAGALPALIGCHVTVGHAAILHACTVGDECLIGMGATILDGAVIGAQSIVGANALVTQGSRIPAGSLVLGMPAKVARPLTAKERATLKNWAAAYVQLGEFWREQERKPARP